MWKFFLAESRSLIHKQKFIVEENARQDLNFPFKTHFVTGYHFEDQDELAKHEQLLHDQLVKDFKLMGRDELQLVDSSYHSYSNNNNNNANNSVASLRRDSNLSKSSQLPVASTTTTSIVPLISDQQQDTTKTSQDQEIILIEKPNDNLRGITFGEFYCNRATAAAATTTTSAAASGSKANNYNPAKKAINSTVTSFEDADLQNDNPDEELSLVMDIEG